nr:MAG TPA: hypothetical protein [Caudoviricetes sp.]
MSRVLAICSCVKPEYIRAFRSLSLKSIFPHSVGIRNILT